MIALYFVAFFIGAMIGGLLMALMASSKDYVVHVYHEPDGKVSILTDDPGVIVEHHQVKKEDE